MVKAAVVGASGYTGLELSRLLVLHPQVDVGLFVARAHAGRDVAAMIPSLDGVVDACFVAPEDADYSACDVVFFAAPGGVAMRDAPGLLADGKVVIDLGADFRLRDARVFGEWYGAHTSPQLLSKAVYGLSELMREDIKKANLIANPGCYATAAEIALLPFANALAEGAIIIDAKSGVSGAGRRTDRAGLLFAEQHGNFMAYATSGHRHLAEITQTLDGAGFADADITFVPHLLPTARGIYLNAYIPLREDASPPLEIIKEYWRDEHFINIKDSVPALADVVGGNRVRLYATTANNKKAAKANNKTTAIVIAALDNLIKGAAGQAIQNMNIRFNLPETAGLL